MKPPNIARSVSLALASFGLLAGALSPLARAQLYSVDQFSLSGTAGPASISLSSTVPVQQQVIAGSTGQLTAVEFYLSGNSGEAAAVRIRRGLIPTSEPVLWEGTVVSSSFLGWEVMLLDTSGAGIHLAAGEHFVLEFLRLTNNIGLMASIYTPPCYPEPSHPGAPAWPNMRVSFRTFMSDPAPGVNYCIPGTSTAVLGAPARIWATGSTSIAVNDLVLYAGPMPDHFALFAYGTATLQVPFGSGYLCITGMGGRLPVMMPHCGMISSPFDLTLAVPQVVAPGTTLHMQAYFRDPYGGGGSHVGLTDGYSITLTP